MPASAQLFFVGSVFVFLGLFWIGANRLHGDLNSRVGGRDLSRLANWGKRDATGRYPGLILQGRISVVVGVVLWIAGLIRLFV